MDRRFVICDCRMGDRFFAERVDEYGVDGWYLTDFKASTLECHAMHIPCSA